MELTIQNVKRDMFAKIELAVFDFSGFTSLEHICLKWRDCALTKYEMKMERERVRVDFVCRG